MADVLAALSRVEGFVRCETYLCNLLYPSYSSPNQFQSELGWSQSYATHGDLLCGLGKNWMKFDAEMKEPCGFK